MRWEAWVGNADKEMRVCHETIVRIKPHAAAD